MLIFEKVIDALHRRQNESGDILPVWWCDAELRQAEEYPLKMAAIAYRMGFYIGVEFLIHGALDDAG